MFISKPGSNTMFLQNSRFAGMMPRWMDGLSVTLETGDHIPALRRRRGDILSYKI